MFRLRTYHLALSLLLLYGWHLNAQPGSSFTADYHPLMQLPGDIRNLSVVDGKMHCYASGVLLQSEHMGEHLTGFWPDTTFAALGIEAEYMVQHPTTGQLYLTFSDKDGYSRLYTFDPQHGKHGKLTRIKLKGMSVEHPVFSPDGNILIFASRDKKNSHGGYDLWYSLRENNHWTRPQNMGNRINTAGDEMCPSTHNGILFFASNGRQTDQGHLNIYATQLLSAQTTGDTVGMLHIGRSRVQRLPYPINLDQSDNSEFWFDSVQNISYWVSNRDRGNSQIYSFTGILDGIMVWGYVTDPLDNRLGGVVINAMQNGTTIASTTTDADGAYRLYLQADQHYSLSFSLPNYFTAFHNIHTVKTNNEQLISEIQLPISLDKLPIGKPIYFYDLYGPNTDLNLSQHGLEQLEPLIRYLHDNPTTTLELTLYCDQTTNASFNSLLTQSRLESLQQTLETRIPSTVKTTLKNGCGGQQSCSDGTGRSQLMVVIQKAKNN